MERCLASALLGFPVSIVIVEPAEEPGGMPKKLGPQTRIPARHGLVMDGLPMVLDRNPDQSAPEQMLPPNHEVARLAVRLPATDFQVALDALQPVLEKAVDLLAFQAQAPIPIVGLELLDATPSLEEGQERDLWHQVNVESNVMPKFFAELPGFHWADVPVDTPRLYDSTEVESRKKRMALWWYIKSLAVPWTIDKFMCLWTAVELLSDDMGFRVDTPYKPDCGHEIHSCPECDKSVWRPARGRGIQKFLVEVGGLDESTARELWRLRQLVHGADVFTVEQTRQLLNQATLIRKVVLEQLKEALGFHATHPPLLVPATGPQISMMGLGGHRTIRADDVILDQELTALTH